MAKFLKAKPFVWKELKWKQVINENEIFLNIFTFTFITYSAATENRFAKPDQFDLKTHPKLLKDICIVNWLGDYPKTTLKSVQKL